LQACESKSNCEICVNTQPYYSSVSQEDTKPVNRAKSTEHGRFCEMSESNVCDCMSCQSLA